VDGIALKKIHFSFSIFYLSFVIEENPIDPISSKDK